MPDRGFMLGLDRPRRHGGSRTPVKAHRYQAPGWGVGELWTAGDTVVWHELPRSGPEPGEQPRLSAVERLQAYFAGEPVDFEDIDLDLEELTDFQRALTDVLRAVPRGETVSYGELAALAGKPGAQRAAGSFCARNRLAIFVPCHRVVAACGPGSYGELGVEYKLRLLALEGWTP